MTFKKKGTDPITSRPNIVSMGGLNWVVNAALQALGIDAATAPQPEDHLRYRRSRRKPTPAKKRPNRLTISKRVRRKHRRAAA